MYLGEGEEALIIILSLFIPFVIPVKYIFHIVWSYTIRVTFENFI